jgi:hypothetical protein
MDRSYLFLLFILIVCTQALYDRHSAVKQLTAADFSQAKKGIWLV